MAGSQTNEMEGGGGGRKKKREETNDPERDDLHPGAGVSFLVRR